MKHIGQLKGCCLPSEQCQTSCLLADPAEIGTAWVGCPTTFALIIWLCTFGLPLILISTKFFHGKKL